MQHPFPQMQKLFDEQIARSRAIGDVRPTNDSAAQDIASRFQTAFNQIEQTRRPTAAAAPPPPRRGFSTGTSGRGEEMDDFLRAFQRAQQRAAPIVNGPLRPTSYQTSTTTTYEPGSRTATRRITQTTRMPVRPRPIPVNRDDSNPLETATSRRQTHQRIGDRLVQLARLGCVLLQHRLPMFESRIQHLLEQPGSSSSEDQIATLFAAIEQTNADIPVLQSINNNAPVTPVQMQCVMRVIQDQYAELTTEVEEDRQRQPAEAEQEDEEDEEEIEETIEEEEEVDNDENHNVNRQQHNVNQQQRRREQGLPPGLIGLAAAMMGAATGMGDLGRMMNVMGMPANFFDNVPVPMSETGLRHMPNITYSEFKDKLTANGEEPNTQCNFCLENFEDADQIRCYPCCPRVAQHTTCLDAWLASHDTCIICKKKVTDVIDNNNSNQ
jgi:hypothetical protein